MAPLVMAVLIMALAVWAVPFPGSILFAAVAATTAEAPGEQFTSPLGIPLVTTGAADIQLRFGRAPVAIVGHQVQAVCYVWPEPRTLLTFTAQAEGLSGGFTMSRLTGAAPSECPAVPLPVAGSLKLDVGGLRLGMRRLEFAAALGKIGPLPDELTGVVFTRSEPIDGARQPLAVGDVLHIEIVVGGRFSRGRLIELVIWKTMSS